MLYLEGARMKIVYSHVEAGIREFVEKECARNFDKINRLLKRYESDVVQVHVSLEKSPRKAEYNFTIHLALPAGTLHASGVGADVRSSAKAGFSEIESQIKKHQEKLRRDYVWKRKRVRRELRANEEA